MNNLKEVLIHLASSGEEDSNKVISKVIIFDGVSVKVDPSLVAKFIVSDD